MPEGPETPINHASRARRPRWLCKVLYAFCAVLAVVFSGLFVPEGRRLLGLERHQVASAAAMSTVRPASRSRATSADKRVAGSSQPR